MNKLITKKWFYLLFIFVSTLVVIVLTPTFAKFPSSYVTEEDVVGLSLDFDIGITNVEEYEQIVAKAGEFTIFNVKVDNISADMLYYGIWYRLSDDTLENNGVVISKLEESEYSTNGSLESLQSKVISIIIINNTDSSIKVDVGVSSSNVSISDIEYLGGKKLISGIYSINYMSTLFDSDETYTYYRSVEYREKIKNASFVDYIEEDLSKVVISWDVSKNGNGSIIAWLENNEVDGFYDLYIGSNELIYAEGLQYLFSYMTELENISFSNLDTSLTTNMNSMFLFLTNLTELDVSMFDTNMVTDMSYMFYGCSSLTSLDLSSFDTNEVTSMLGMFYACEALSDLNLSSFNTSKVTDMMYMFCDCSSLTRLDLNNFVMNNVSRMDYIFSGCSSLTDIYLRGADFYNVSSYEAVFSGVPIPVNIYVMNEEQASWITEKFTDLVEVIY